MEKFTTLAELTAYLADKDYPDLFQTELTAAIARFNARLCVIASVFYQSHPVVFFHFLFLKTA